MMKKKHFYAAVILLLFLAAGIQPALATRYIPSDTGIGTWDPVGRKYTLTTDVTETIQIDEDNLTLDGAGHTVSWGSGTQENGVYVQDKSYVTIKNLNVQNFHNGIHLLGCTDNTLIDNSIGNSVGGSNVGSGILLSTHSSGNTLTNNTASSNKCAIQLFCYSNNNTLTNNTALSNTWYAIFLNNCSNGNTLTGNTVSNNFGGICLDCGSNNNTIYHNNFINSIGQAWVSGNCTGNVFNLHNPIGGNYWSDYWGVDRGDGIGNVPYTFNEGQQDDLPWTRQDGWLNQPPVADAGPDQTVECACQQGGTQVTLDGSGSTGASTYTWTGLFYENPASGATPTVTLNGCQPEYEITLVVNDGELDSEPDTVTIMVVDTTPPDITPPGDTTVEAMGPDGVPVDDDRIQAFLNGASATDNCDATLEIIITNDAPTVFLPGDTIVNFRATDTSGNTDDVVSTCQSTVTVVEAAESHLRIIPRIINREGRLEKILAVIRFPEGTTEEDIDIGQPLILYPGDSPYGIEAINQRIVSWYRWGTLRVSVFASFSKDEVTAGVPEDGPVELMVIGRFTDGQYFYGLDNVWIISWDWPCW